MERLPILSGLIIFAIGILPLASSLRWEDGDSVIIEGPCVAVSSTLASPSLNQSKYKVHDFIFIFPTSEMVKGSPTKVNLRDIHNPYSEYGLGEGRFEVTIPSFSDFTVQRSESQDSIISAQGHPFDGADHKGKKNKGKREGTMASITQEIDTMPDSGFIHGYLFQGDWYKRFRSLFLVSDRSRIHRLGYRSPVSVFVERSRHLASFPNIIHPYSAFRWYWDILMTLFLLMTLLLDPVRMTFYAQLLNEGGQAHVIVGIVVTLVYLTDIVLNFRTGLVDSQSDLVTLDPALIARNYLTTWFLIDLISTIPFDLIYMITEKGRAGRMEASDINFSKAVRLMELFKVFRLIRAIRYISRLLFAYKVSRMYIMFLELVTASMFLTHWQACGHYLIPDLFNEDLPTKKPGSWVTQKNLWNASVGKKYLHAYHRTICLTTGMGLGLDSPTEPEEILLNIINILIGFTGMACYIGMVGAILNSRGMPERKYVEILNQVKEYMRFKQVPLVLQDRILLFYETRYQRNFFREHDILSSISDVLRRELLMHNCRHLVEQVPIFQNLPSPVIYAIISKLQFDVYLPLDMIVTINTVGDSMYFIEHGMVSILAENGSVMGHLRDGDFFGELALISTERRVVSVVATSNCNAYRLSRDDFNTAMNGYPELLERIMKIAQTRNTGTVMGMTDLVRAWDEKALRALSRDILKQIRSVKPIQDQHQQSNPSPSSSSGSDSESEDSKSTSRTLTQASIKSRKGKPKK